MMHGNSPAQLLLAALAIAVIASPRPSAAQNPGQLVERHAAGKTITINHIEGPVGVRSRNFSNGRIESIGWESKWPLKRGIAQTYAWVEKQVQQYGAAAQ